MACDKTYERDQVVISKLPAGKIEEYIRKVEIDGLPRVRAYAEVIDPRIYDLEPNQIKSRLDSIRTRYNGYDEIHESVMAEHKEWSLRRSSALQNKALDLLSNLIDKANEIATKPEADAKELNIAVSTLKSILPAFTAVSNAGKANLETTDKKARASAFIN